MFKGHEKNVMYVLTYERPKIRLSQPFSFSLAELSKNHMSKILIEKFGPLISDLTGLDPRTATPRQVKEELRAREPVITETELERNLTVLELLDRRGTLYYLGEVDPGLNVLLDFICTKWFRLLWFIRVAINRLCIIYIIYVGPSAPENKANNYIGLNIF